MEIDEYKKFVNYHTDQSCSNCETAERHAKRFFCRPMYGYVSRDGWCENWRDKKGENSDST